MNSDIAAKYKRLMFHLYYNRDAKGMLICSFNRFIVNMGILTQ